MTVLLWSLGGALLGGLFGGISGAVAGLLIGFVAGFALRPKKEASGLDARVAALESEVAALREALRFLGAEPAAKRREAAPAEEAPQPHAPAPQPAPGFPLAAEETLPPPAAPPPPLEPNALEQAFARAKAWLFGGNTVVRLGVLVLFFGLAFLARLAVEQGLVPVELRLAGIAAGALALLALGWRLRESRRGYALTLQGGGVAALYLTVFAALRLYALLPPGFAFALLLAMVLLSAALALLQNAPALAVIATAGGFVAPIIASTGQGSHVQLFTYYTLLNAGVVLLAWRRAWRLLNLVGFLFTFVIGLAWGVRFYQPAFFASTEPFLVVFFLMYAAAAVLYAQRHAPNLRHNVDGTLVFGVPVVGFGLQAALVRELPFVLAWSALAVGAFYLLLARWLWDRSRLRLLVEAFLALGIAFLTLAIPLALEGRWTAAAWALEGAALLWVGLRQERRLASAAGVLLQLAAGAAFAQGADMAHPVRALPLANAYCVGSLLIALAGFVSARLALARRSLWSPLPAAGWLLLAWGSLWWLMGGVAELDAWLTARQMPAAVLAFLAASGALAAFLAGRLSWPELRAASLIPMPGMLLALLAAVVDGASPARFGGWIAWPLALAAHLWGLRGAESALPEQLLKPWHVAGVWWASAAAAFSLAWEAERALAGEAWALAAFALVPAAVLAALHGAARSSRWPFGPWRSAYALAAPAGLAAVLALWSLGPGLVSDGDPRPLPYLPLLNPLDLLLALALVLLARWLLQVRDWARAAGRRGDFGYLLPPLAGLGFLAANAVLMRAMHHYAGVRYDLPALFAADTVQTALSLFWSFLSLGLMVWASRARARTPWLAGAALMGVVVLKLFLVDMASSGTVARIVSFIGAGLLMLAVGYLSPLPPRAQQPQSATP